MASFRRGGEGRGGGTGEEKPPRERRTGREGTETRCGAARRHVHDTDTSRGVKSSLLCSALPE